MKFGFGLCDLLRYMTRLVLAPLLLVALLSPLRLARAQRRNQLRDYPVVGDASPLYLDGSANWSARNSAASEAGKNAWATLTPSVPGDIITDLQTAGHIPEVRVARLFNDMKGHGFS